MVFYVIFIWAANFCNEHPNSMLTISKFKKGIFCSTTLEPTLFCMQLANHRYKNVQ
jgi:hypothetical protein